METKIDLEERGVDEEGRTVYVFFYKGHNYMTVCTDEVKQDGS